MHFEDEELVLPKDVVLVLPEDKDPYVRLTVPFGGGVGRVFKIGKQPLNMKVSGYYNVEKPDYAADWNLQTS
jgi:hypothetical protein